MSPQLSRDALAAITAAQQLATEMGDEYVSTEHLLVGLATGRTTVAELLRRHGATPAALRGGLATGRPTVADLLRRHGATPEALREAFTKVRGSARVTSPDPEGSYQ